jgi:hypothetical protein
VGQARSQETDDGIAILIETSAPASASEPAQLDKVIGAQRRVSVHRRDETGLVYERSLPRPAGGKQG